MKSWFKTAVLAAVAIVIIVSVVVPVVVFNKPNSSSTNMPGKTTSPLPYNTTPVLTDTTFAWTLTSSTGNGSNATTTATTSASTSSGPCKSTAIKTTTPEPPPRCSPKGVLAPRGYCQEDPNGRCYCVYYPSVPDGWIWPHAEWYCSNTSMSLLSLTDANEEHFVASLTGSGGFWLSAKRTSPALSWTWSLTEEPVSYNNWAKPTFAQDLGCASLKVSQGSSSWYVNDCTAGGLDNSHAIVCEEPSVPIQPSGCPADVTGYPDYMTWYPGVSLENKLICFSSHWTSKVRARTLCSGAGLQLVSLQDLHKNELIRQYILKHRLDHGDGFWTSGECFMDKWTWATSADVTFNLFNQSDPTTICNTDNYFRSIWINAEENLWLTNTEEERQYRQVICEKL